jgi:hypothetical protein
MVIRFTTPREIERQRAEERKKIEEFWRCFQSVSAELFTGTHDELPLTELSNHLNAIDPGLIWETSPGESKRCQLTISPNLDKNLRETAKTIVSAAPALEDWEFHHARRPRQWDYKLRLESEHGAPIEIDASGWLFIALYYSSSGTYQVLLHGSNLPPLTKDQRWQAAEAVLIHLLGEEVVLDLIHDFGLVNTLEPLDALSTKPIRLLRETVAGPSDWKFLPLRRP